MIALLTSIIKFEARRMSRNFAPVFFALAFPVMMLLIFGGIYGNKPSAQFEGRGVVDSAVPAYLVLVVAVTGLMSFPLGLAEYRERKILKRFRVTPAPRGALLVAQGLVNLVTSILGALLLLVVGFAVFGLHSPAHIGFAVGALLLAALTMYSVGAMVASLARSERAATIAVNLIYFPMIFLSGATIPAGIFPSTMKTIADVIPATYGVRLLQNAWLGTRTNIALDVVVMVAICLSCAALAVRFFRWE